MNGIVYEKVKVYGEKKLLVKILINLKELLIISGIKEDLNEILLSP